MSLFWYTYLMGSIDGFIATGKFICGMCVTATVLVAIFYFAKSVDAYEHQESTLTADFQALKRTLVILFICSIASSLFVLFTPNAATLKEMIQVTRCK